MNSTPMASSSRFIPVGTGNAMRSFRVITHHPVHPRGHGERMRDIAEVTIKRGSSPWARGTRDEYGDYQHSQRFIPVGTGNAGVEDNRALFHSVHPRGHGERHYLFTKSELEYGSSPWARGTPRLTIRRINQFRFIPVGTGNAEHHAFYLLQDAVHPRGHGERGIKASHRIVKFGSSPWARGTQGTPISRASYRRFIPVGTGNAGFVFGER